MGFITVNDTLRAALSGAAIDREEASRVTRKLHEAKVTCPTHNVPKVLMRILDHSRLLFFPPKHTDLGDLFPSRSFISVCPICQPVVTAALETLTEMRGAKEIHSGHLNSLRAATVINDGVTHGYDLLVD